MLCCGVDTVKYKMTPYQQLAALKLAILPLAAGLE